MKLYSFMKHVSGPLYCTVLAIPCSMRLNFAAADMHTHRARKVKDNAKEMTVAGIFSAKFADCFAFSRKSRALITEVEINQRNSN